MGLTAATAEVVMPRLGDAPVVVEWLKPDGGEVAPGDELVTIAGNEIEIGVEAETGGVLRILEPAGSAVPAGTVIGFVGERDGGAAALAAGRGASPVARRAAQALGVDLGELVGSGANGRIVKDDVLRASEASAAGADPASGPSGAEDRRATRIALSRLQQTVARRMLAAKTEMPEFWASVDVDMSDALELRVRLKERHPVAPTVNDLIVRAVVVALQRNPRVNSAFRDDAIDELATISVGIAVARDGALIVPVLANIGELSLRDLAARSRDLIERTRQGTVTPAEVGGGTFTVSNLGMLGVDRFGGIINAPESAILSVGATRPRAVVDGDRKIVARDVATMTLVSDHRVIYGADAAGFLSDLRAVLEDPLELLA